MPTLSARDLLVSAVQEGRPIVLLLGQGAHSETDSDDQVLTAALTKLGRDRSPEGGWTALLDEDRVEPPFYDWLAERFRRRVAPPSLSTIAEIPWSALFTSTLDPMVATLVEGGNRVPELILAANETPRAVRSVSRPPVYCLFGRAGSLDASTRPPTNRMELNARRIGHAIPMLGTVLDTATTIGIVVVDGVVPGRDWLRTDDVLGAFGHAARNQVLWFGDGPEPGTSESLEFEAAVKQRRIVVDPTRLGSVLSELLTIGRLEALRVLDSQEAGQISLGNGRFLEVSPEERLRVEAVCSIVDDAWTGFLAPQGADTEYDTFRRFHGDVGGRRLLVEGVRRGFAITRAYEHHLSEIVLGALADHASVDEPIIVHGQSGTGKSIALARVAATVRESKAGVVLYSVGRVPQAEQIAGFCQEADQAGSQATLVVCDANQETDRYRDLLVRLRSRGRRVVVIGSRYRISDAADHHRSMQVEAPSELRDGEREALAELLRRFASERVTPKVFDDYHMLALLYRFLPPSRVRIAAGLSAEAFVTEQELRIRGSKPRTIEPQTLLAQRLVEAGLSASATLWTDDGTESASDSRDAAGRLIDLVMVSGSLNCDVPVNLLMRAVTDTLPGMDIVSIADVFRSMDLFRWDWADDERNELLVCPRLTLEAELICARRLGGPEREADLLLELIGTVRGNGVDARHERTFLLKLLDAIGDQGPRGRRYVQRFAEVGRALTRLRTRFGVVHASLMLQESAFRRAAVRHGSVDDHIRLPLLEEARDAVQTALDGIDAGTVTTGRRTRQNLLVERASLYGFLAYDCAQRDSRHEDVWSSYQAARVAIREAVSVTNNYYPLDIGLWTPADLLDIANLTDPQRAEIAADIYSTLDQVDADTLPPKQQEKFQVRQMRLGPVLADTHLTEEAFRTLAAMGSTAGYFLKARMIAPPFERKLVEFNTSDQVSRAQRAADFLQSNLDKIDGDERCLSLLFECRWIAVMRCRAFRGRRQPLPAAAETRREFLGLLRALNISAGESARHVTRYLEAVLAWLSGAESDARRLFAELGRDSEFEDWGRVVRRHRITSADGTPQVFGGRVVRKRSEGHWLVRVDNLDRIVDLLERDFREDEIATGRYVGRFGIAFNYIGPIADPLERGR